jgi:hypothetical protein
MDYTSDQIETFGFDPATTLCPRLWCRHVGVDYRGHDGPILYFVCPACLFIFERVEVHPARIARQHARTQVGLNEKQNKRADRE